MLYNPRQQRWKEHFQLDDTHIIPLSPEGRVTVFMLNLNNEIRIRARQALLGSGNYPPKRIG